MRLARFRAVTLDSVFIDSETQEAGVIKCTSGDALSAFQCPEKKKQLRGPALSRMVSNEK